MYFNPSTHDQPLRPECLSLKENSPLHFSSDSKYNIGQVNGDAFDLERERRDTPPTDRFSVDCRRGANKSKVILSTGD